MFPKLRFCNRRARQLLPLLAGSQANRLIASHHASCYLYKAKRACSTLVGRGASSPSQDDPKFMVTCCSQACCGRARTTRHHAVILSAPLRAWRAVAPAPEACVARHFRVRDSSHSRQYYIRLRVGPVLHDPTYTGRRARRQQPASQPMRELIRLSGLLSSASALPGTSPSGDEMSPWG
jgi:hypothetical protein